MKNEYVSCALDNPDDNISSKEKKNKKKFSLTSKLFAFMPILTWLPNYKWKEDFHGDLIAGLTVGIMHVPQGMAYATLACVPPVMGMYSSFFASSIYMFFGTARHISIGVIAVGSMMIGTARLRLAPDYISNSTSSDYPLGEYVTPAEFTSSLTLIVGCIQLIMAVLKLSFLTTYLSDPLVAGFTTGSAVHVFTSQLNKIFGVSMPRHEGVGMIVKMIRDVVISLYDGKINHVVFFISSCGILFLYLTRTYVNPLIKKYSSIPPPLELILVIIGVIISIVFKLDTEFDVKTVHTIPRGFPTAAIPRLDIIPALLPDAISIAIVSYMFLISMGKLFAKKHKYKTDAGQEMYAIGIFSTLSSIFPVFPVGASLARSSVCEMSGVNTLLYTIFSSTLLLTVILFLGPFLEPLPMCILAAIVIVSLKNVFMQVVELPRLWKLSKTDFYIWIVACMATIFTDATTGLLMALVFSLFSIVFRQQWPNFCTISANEDLCSRQDKPSFVEIVRYESSVNFTNVVSFSDNLLKVVNRESEDALEKRVVIVDCRAISYLDIMGIEAFKEVYVDAKKANVRIIYSGLEETIVQKFNDAEDLKILIEDEVFQPSIDSSIRFIRNSLVY